VTNEVTYVKSTPSNFLGEECSELS